MGKKTNILWTDSTFNPWIGCRKVSPGCANCYAETQASHWWPDQKLWDGNFRPTSEKYWQAPLKWNEDAEKAGKPQTVFCGSMCDFAQNDTYLDRVRPFLWQLIDKTPNLIWLLLTKREMMLPWAFPIEWYENSKWPKNVWVGVTVEDQQRTNRAVELCRLANRTGCKTFISVEPMLGPVDLKHCRMPGQMATFDALSTGLINWVIYGFESGHKARPGHPAWVQDGLDQCRSNNISVFFKQWGQWTPATSKINLQKLPRTYRHDDGQVMIWHNKKEAAGDLLYGYQIHEFPVEFMK